MNALLPLFTAAGDAADQKAANLLAAGRALAPHLNRSRTLDRKLVSGVMTTTFGASDAEGAWLWRDAYDAIEAALVLQLRRLSPQIGRLEDAPKIIRGEAGTIITPGGYYGGIENGLPSTFDPARI